MPYPIIDIEVTQPLPTLTISEEDTGIALVVRRKDKAVGLIMQPLPPKSVLSPEDLAKMIEREVGAKLLQEAIREELNPTEKGDTFPSLTVAICTKDRPENLARCLQHLLKLQTPISGENLNFEVLVIDNAPSNEKTQELVDSLPGVRYAREPKPGLDFARNRALQEATGEILAFLDDDVTPDRQWLNGLREAWAENPDAGGFTGLVLPYELATEAQILFESRGGFRRGFEKIRYGKILPHNPLYPCGAGIFGAGCNMAFRRDVLLKLGGFDDALDTGAPLPGGGDLDIFYRVVRAGYPLVYDPRYLVFHQHRREYEKLRRQYWTWGLGFMAFVIKSYQTDPAKRSQLIRLIAWWMGYQLDELQKSIRGCHPLPPTMILAEMWGGIVGLFGEYPRSLKRIEQIRRQFA
ncbi:MULTISPECIES: glycosyltransferase [unclassified Microcoleus]|uniref:glycosyltransferase n=1 Tax=unclassified Microcoleus TaxID=2642155 RepID=UPI002FCE7827